MVKIAAHHIPGTERNRLSVAMGMEPVEYAPTCAWPDDCTVQWGHGIIPAVPFFEAFPPGTFIRGEGATIAEAEQSAYAQYQRDIACDHVWGRHREGRGTYTNGAGWCRKCGGFRGRMFNPIVKLGHMRAPLGLMERDYLTSLEDEKMNEHMDRKYPGDVVRRAKSRRTLQIRLNLYGVEPSAVRS